MTLKGQNVNVSYDPANRKQELTKAVLKDALESGAHWLKTPAKPAPARASEEGLLLRNVYTIFIVETVCGNYPFLVKPGL